MHFLSTLTVLFFAAVSSADEGYYWREYMGWVPEDALVVGLDTFGNKINIGQTYLRNAGLLIGRVNSRENYLFAPYNGVVLVGKYIKVLCGDPEDFYWKKVRKLITETEGKHVVVGGYEDVGGYINIGRIFKNGEYIVGKVSAFWKDNAAFYYAENGLEFQVGEYEVLLYNGTTV